MKLSKYCPECGGRNDRDAAWIIDVQRRLLALEARPYPYVQYVQPPFISSPSPYTVTSGTTSLGPHVTVHTTTGARAAADVAYGAIATGGMPPARARVGMAPPPKPYNDPAKGNA
ncbi:MAG: hypothetical protein NVSMB64_29910 [Candidatus Velthaea sp.]